MKLLSFGEIVWDVHGDNASLGGAPLNLAVHTAMQGEDAILVSAVGNDKLGHRALEIAESYGVDVSCVTVLECCETAICTVAVGENGQPSYRLEENASFDRISMPKIMAYVDIISFGTLSLRHDNNRKIIDGVLNCIPHGEVFCDINLRAPFYCRDTVKYCLSNADIVKISDEELPEVGNVVFGGYRDIDDTAKELSETYKNVRMLIITLGAKGAICYDTKHGRRYKTDAKKTEVVSTVGAGDSFSAAFLSRLMRGESIDRCLEYASDIGAMVCSEKAAFSKELSARINEFNGGER